MVKNPDFFQCKEERKHESFFKILQSADLFSENTRALPHEFVKNLSDKELSRKMKIRAKWGSSWEVEIRKNPIFYFMDKCGWEKLLKEIGSVDIECLVFTHDGNFSFTLNIFKHDGIEILQLQPYPSTLCRIKTEQRGDGIGRDVKKEEAVLSETSGGGKFKRKLSFEGKKKGKEESPKPKKKTVSVRRSRFSNGASSSSSLGEFTIFIHNSYLNSLPVPLSVEMDVVMPHQNSEFVIHDQDKKRSWTVSYLAKERSQYASTAVFSAGWRLLAREYPLAVGDKCKFTVIKPGELLLQLSKP